ncbi:hypothetical protein WI560_26980 [Bradyrhizobium sp. A11]|jgi:hypothetical protein|uniref:hypothetical protein n=1 Tax=Bradyrhizobium sp. A11 TaxID=3133974 RepID=UPI0032494A3D
MNTIECTHRPSFIECIECNGLADRRRKSRDGRAIPDPGVSIVDSGIRNIRQEGADLIRRHPPQSVGSTGPATQSRTLDGELQ